MSEQQEKVFADGIIFTRRRREAPEFIKGHVSIKVEDFVKFVEKHKKADGWVNFDLLQPKDPEKRPYFQLNTFVPKTKSELSEDPEATPF